MQIEYSTIWKDLYFHSYIHTVYTNQEISDYLSYRKVWFTIRKLLKPIIQR